MDGLRDASVDDLDGVWRLVEQFGATFAPDRVAFEATFARALDEPECLIEVAERDGAVVGYLLAAVHPTFLANGPVAWVEEIAVATEHRRQGIGRALMTSAERWADQQGAAYVSLASRRAGDFYRALGYDEAATFYKHPLTRPVVAVHASRSGA